MRLLPRLTKSSIFAASALALFAVLSAFAASGDTTADRVWGHTGSFTSGVCNPGGVVTPSGLCSPRGVALDSSGRLYVADNGNNRVLEYDNPLACTPAMSALCDANNVYGQGGNFMTNSCPGPPSATSLCGPTGVAVDATGHLYVADSLNCRVLEYDSAPTNQTANKVFGELTSSTNSNCSSLGISATTLGRVDGVAVDNIGVGHLYVADNNNHRVLRYDNPLGCTPTPCAANQVFGQLDMTAGMCNQNGSTTARDLCNPRGVTLGSNGHLYIADEDNARVLEFDNPTATSCPANCDPNATGVFGQGGSFTTGHGASCSPTANTLCTPTGVAVDNLVRLYIADGGIGAGDSLRSRVLEYSTSAGCTTTCVGPTATGVLGGSFTGGPCNNGGATTADTLCVPNSVTTDSARDVYVSDTGDSGTSGNRVLEYDNPFPTSVGGIAEEPDVTALITQRATSSNSFRYSEFALTGMAMFSVAVTGWYVTRRWRRR